MSEDIQYTTSIHHIDIPQFNQEVSVGGKSYVKNLVKNPKKKAKNYVKSLFPFISWFPHYVTNFDWILSDFITGVTVAIVLVPQAMSYAKLANLSPQFGLYSAFIGSMFYFVFATSREICIGPVAVLSLQTGKIIASMQEKYGNEFTAQEIGTTLALIAGGIVFGIGLLRLGFIVELISLPAILAYTSGSAINIVASQLPALMGYKSLISTNKDATYKIFVEFLKDLPHTKSDAAFGLIGLFVLYLWEYICEYLVKRTNDSRKKKIIIQILNLRTAFVIIISTCISYGILKNHKGKKYPYSITGVIPSGLNHVGRFVPPASIASKLGPDIPIATIVMVLEHISISKSFARINGYRVDPNQEFIAIGFTNLIGTFFGAYPVTGSFSRTALSAKCGVKSPFKSAITGACVLLSIYCFTSGFYYIPAATLSAIIIHCVTSLFTSYKLTTQLYMFSPVDCVIFIVGVFVTVFASIEDGIYWAMCASCASILWNLCITNGTFLGRVKVASVQNPLLTAGAIDDSSSEIEKIHQYPSSKTNDVRNSDSETASDQSSSLLYRYKWVPLKNIESNPSYIHTRYINDRVSVEDPPKGVFVYRLSENFIYANASRQLDNIFGEIKKSVQPHDSNREKLWCEYSLSQFKSGKKNQDIDEDNKVEEKPSLRILHLDFSQVVSVDATSIQTLIDLRSTISNYAGEDWELHFSGIINPWVVRALINAGFGKPFFGDTDSIANKFLKKNIKSLYNDHHESSYQQDYVYEGDLEVAPGADGKLNALYDTSYPFFHDEIPSYSEYY